MASPQEPRTHSQIREGDSFGWQDLPFYCSHLTPGQAYLWGTPLKSDLTLASTAPGTSTLASVMAPGQGEACGGPGSLSPVIHLDPPRPGTSAHSLMPPPGEAPFSPLHQNWQRPCLWLPQFSTVATQLRGHIPGTASKSPGCCGERSPLTHLEAVSYENVS